MSIQIVGHELASNKRTETNCSEEVRVY